MKSLLFVLLGLGYIWAQSCCTATGSNRFAVVGRCQKATIAAAFAAEWPQGSVDQNRKFQEDQNQTFSSYRLRLGGGWKWTDSFQSYLSTALEGNFLDQSKRGSRYSVGIKDINIGSQYTLLEDQLQGMTRGHWMPFWDLFAGIQIPTGRTQTEAKGQLEQVHGSGDQTWNLGSRVVKFISPLWAFSIEGSYSHSLEKENDNPLLDTFQKGSTWNSIVGFQYIPSIFWSIGSTFSKTWSDAPLNDGKQNASDASETSSFSLYGVYAISFPRLESNFSITLPATFASKNIPSTGPSINLGINWNFLPGSF